MLFQGLCMTWKKAVSRTTWPIAKTAGLYYWLIPLFAMSGSLDYFMYLSTAGHVLWTAYIMWKSYRYRCEICIAPISPATVDA